MFLSLCSWTCPHGYESAYYGDLLRAEGFVEDAVGNWYRTIGESSVAFMAHLDTVGSVPEPVVVCVSAEGEVSTLGDMVLGADDRAGITVLLWMARNHVPGRYCLFVGEEQGCAGSAIAASDEARWKDVRYAISFDRRGTNSVITHQCGVRTASDEFARALCTAGRELGLEWRPDDTGVYTDSEVFQNLISECTNISVGYEGQHTTKETQDLVYLDRLCEAVCMIDWESLPYERIPGEDDDRWARFWSEERRSNDKWYSGDGFSPWDRVELALELGQAPDAEDLRYCVNDDPEYVARLIGSYLGQTN